MKSNREQVDNLKREKEAVDKDLLDLRQKMELAFKLNHDIGI